MGAGGVRFLDLTLTGGILHGAIPLCPAHHSADPSGHSAQRRGRNHLLSQAGHLPSRRQPGMKIYSVWLCVCVCVVLPELHCGVICRWNTTLWGFFALWG